MFLPLLTLPFFRTLYIGVPIFLMLSMYLLLGSLEKNDDLKHYFLRRIKRIWPIYWGSLVVFYFVFKLPLGSFLQYFFFIQYFLHPQQAYPVALSVFWTLQLEEFAYLAIPLISKLNLEKKRLLSVAMISIGIFCFATANPSVCRWSQLRFNVSLFHVAYCLTAWDCWFMLRIWEPNFDGWLLVALLSFNDQSISTICNHSLHFSIDWIRCYSKKSAEILNQIGCLWRIFLRTLHNSFGIHSCFRTDWAGNFDSSCILHRVLAQTQGDSQTAQNCLSFI